MSLAEQQPPPPDGRSSYDGQCPPPAPYVPPCPTPTQDCPLNCPEEDICCFIRPPPPARIQVPVVLPDCEFRCVPPIYPQ